MMFIGTSREKFFYHNTLLCLVKSLQNKNVTIDLRNDSYVCGELTTVDGYMNLTLNKAVYCDTRGNEFSFDNLFLQARNIRYVHIPETPQSDTANTRCECYPHINIAHTIGTLWKTCGEYLFTMMSILGSIKNELNKGKNDPNKDQQRPMKSRKATKALQRHMQVVAELETLK